MGRLLGSKLWFASGLTAGLLDADSFGLGLQACRASGLSNLRSFILCRAVSPAPGMLCQGSLALQGLWLQCFQHSRLRALGTESSGFRAFWLQGFRSGNQRGTKGQAQKSSALKREVDLTSIGALKFINIHPKQNG